MALIDENGRCTLCGELLGDASDWIATTMVGLQPPLSRMDDSAAHHECLKKWDHKHAFVEAYNSRCGETELLIDEEGIVRNSQPESSLLAWYLWFGNASIAALVYWISRHRISARCFY